ncbi:hypothetical protein NR798_24300 [Archangium gephyra]|uniref:hypothetical protein n=1 Tax=Archangium gephyra TaxID=48 RepID=UPI0035D51DF5
MRVETQKHDQWCWAAIAVSISQYYEKQASPWTQCMLANRELGMAADCCVEGDSCNTSWYLERALNRVGHYREYRKLVPTSSQFPLIKQELDSGRLPCVRVSWRKSTEGHFLLITGYITDHQNGRWREFLDVSDPRYGSDTRTLEYSHLMSRYRSIGVWTHTYLTL